MVIRGGIQLPDTCHCGSPCYPCPGIYEIQGNVCVCPECGSVYQGTNAVGADCFSIICEQTGDNRHKCQQSSGDDGS